MMLYNKVKVRILFKSGNSHEIWLYSYNMKTQEGEIGSTTWRGCGVAEQIIHYDQSQIEAVFVVNFRKGLFGAKT